MNWFLFSLVALAAVRVDCTRVNSAAAPPRVGGLASALSDLRKPNGDPAPMSVEAFNAEVKDLALYLLGQKQPKVNRFISARTGKIDFDEALRSLFAEDKQLVENAVNDGIQRAFNEITYGGKTTTEVLKDIASRNEVLILTHQIDALQPKVKELEPNPVYLIGGESAPPLSSEALERADLIRHSVGGNFDFSLAGATKVKLGGGALDQCLVQTIHGVALQTTKPLVEVEILMSHAYVDLAGGTHADLATFASQGDGPAIAKRFQEEVRELLKLDGFKLEKPKAKGPAFQPLIFRKGSRTMRIVFTP